MIFTRFTVLLAFIFGCTFAARLAAPTLALSVAPPTPAASAAVSAALLHCSPASSSVAFIVETSSMTGPLKLTVTPPAGTVPGDHGLRLLFGSADIDPAKLVPCPDAVPQEVELTDAQVVHTGVDKETTFNVVVPEIPVGKAQIVRFYAWVDTLPIGAPSELLSIVGYFVNSVAPAQPPLPTLTATLAPIPDPSLSAQFKTLISGGGMSADVLSILTLGVTGLFVLSSVIVFGVVCSRVRKAKTTVRAELQHRHIDPKDYRITTTLPIGRGRERISESVVSCPVLAPRRKITRPLDGGPALPATIVENLVLLQ